MKLKFPPAIVFLFFAGLMYALAKYLSVGTFDFFGRELLLKIIFGLGLLIASVAIFQFRRKKTTVNPLEPNKVSSLVTSGIFNYTRNPMYLGLLLILIAVGLFLQNAFNTLLVGGFVFYMNRFQILPEEEILAKRFGQEYKLYLKAVRRWF